MRMRFFTLVLILIAAVSACGRKDETVKTYFPNGRVMTETTSSGQKTFYENGQTAVETSMRGGIKEGREMVYYPGGKVMTENFYEKGEVVSIKQYYESGQLRMEADFKEKNWKRYDEEGHLLSVGRM